MNNTVSLLYPDGYKSGGSIIGDKVVESLELRYIAMLICPYNTEFALGVLTDFVTDERLIAWRQDVLEDFIALPQLEIRLYKSIHTIYRNSLGIYARSGSSQSFFELMESIKSIEDFAACMEECHEFIREYGARVKSEGVKAVLNEIESRYRDGSFKQLMDEVSKLKSALESGVKSVTFGVNLDSLMRPSEVMLLSVSREQIKRHGIFERLTQRGHTAEPISTVYSRMAKNGETAAVDQLLFDELDKLGNGFLRQFNVSISNCYRDCTEFLMKLAPEIEFFVGAKDLADRSRSLGLSCCRPKILPMSERKSRLIGMSDPVLVNKVRSVGMTDPNVPKIKVNDCQLDGSGRICIITGTNNGGKTTYIRAAAVNQILFQAGLYVYAQEAEMSPCGGIFVHYPSEEKAGINTSRFTEECKNLKEIVNRADEYSLVLLNESLSSTNPYDSLIIAEELLKIFSDMGCRLLYTTHVIEIAELSPKINLLNLRSSLKTLTAGCDEKGRPTYEITAGRPDFSRNAQFIFNKYGISYERYKSGEG